VAVDQKLLDTARDYFHFVTKFFEVIKLSAPHIYHSALELSPKSSIIWKHYHYQLLQHPRPRVVYGAPSSWNQPSIIDRGYGSSAWSPCGQFFSVQTPTSVEVWNALTIEKCSDLQITKTHLWNYYCSPDVFVYSPDMLAYSPDGSSLAGCFGSVITIWDIQTGGVVEEIDHGVKRVLPKLLAWSSDGMVICAIFPVEVGTWDAVTYNIASGKEVSTRRFSSSVKPHLWLQDNSLQAMVMPHTKGFQGFIINILIIWPPSIDYMIESFPIKLNSLGIPPTLPFSPSTY